MADRGAITVKRANPLAEIADVTPEQLQLIKDTVAQGATDSELALFLHVAKTTGLDPLRKQIHAVKRWDSKLRREAMAIQTGIDGYRVMAERTGKYAPGKEATFVHDKNGKLVSATSYIKKLAGGVWHDVTATALYVEYVAVKRDGKPNRFWATKAHIMLAKCSEALALRRAFPDALSGMYVDEEMQQADNPEGVAALPREDEPEPAGEPEPANAPGEVVDADFAVVDESEPLCINAAQVKMISTAVAEYAKRKGRDVEDVWQNIKDLYKVDSRKKLTSAQTDEILKTIEEK